MFLLKWIKKIFNPESEVETDPFADLQKEKTSELVVKPASVKKKTTHKSKKGKKNG
jgi:hypothetical protein